MSFWIYFNMLHLPVMLCYAQKKIEKSFRKIGAFSDNPNPQRRPFLEFELFWLVRTNIFIGRTYICRDIFK